MFHDLSIRILRHRLTTHAANLPSADLAQHDAVCGEFAAHMDAGTPAPRSSWLRLAAYQAERGKRAKAGHVGPRIIDYEVSVGDGPGALPIRLSNPVPCY